LPKIIDYSMHR